MMKLYFRQDEDEFCTTIEAHKEYMRENDITELTIYQAKRTTGTGYFWCTHFHEVGEVGEGCGKECEAYSPRNGKNGRCRYSGYLYETDKKRILTASGQLKIDRDENIKKGK